MTLERYRSAVRAKLASRESSGIAETNLRDMPMFDFQRALTVWAMRRGRAAIFADTGLGKTRMQLAWADAATRRGGRSIILAPLAVAQQTVREADEIGVRCVHRYEQSEIQDEPIVITNYDRLHRFDPSAFSAVVLDESSIIKHHDAKSFRRLTDAFAHTEYRLCTTATPAPNDYTELGTHAEFLGICARTDMLAEFFVHDGGQTQVWRLKGHGRDAFWRWLSSWGAIVRSPADLGFDASRYDIPPFETHHHRVASMGTSGELFTVEASTLMDRRRARRESLDDRVASCAKIVNASSDPWVIWCDLNAEGDALTRAIPDAVEVRGSHDIDTKERRLLDFSTGATRVIVTKPSIAGFGLNWQHCAHVAFVGVTDSFEAYYQAVRRCWRFGQDRSVQVHVFASDAEGAVVANLAGKEKRAREMADAMTMMTRDAVRSEVTGQRRLATTHDATRNVNIPPFINRSNTHAVH